jgi:hypothetical protein
LALKLLSGGSTMPCVAAAPRAIIRQMLSSNCGDTRTNSTCGAFATYAVQFAKKVRGLHELWSPVIIGGVTSAMSKSDAEITAGCSRGIFFVSLMVAILVRGNPASVRNALAGGGVAPDIFCSAAAITLHAFFSGTT